MTKYIFTFLSTEGKVKHVINNNNLCEDVVRTFMYFLRGVSFHQDSIINAFSNIVDEYEQENKKGDE